MTTPTNRQHAEKIVEILLERGFHQFQDDVDKVEQYLNSAFPEKEELCQHSDIVLITETPTDGKQFQLDKKYVKCADCGEILPINSITVETIFTPLIPDE